MRVFRALAGALVLCLAIPASAQVVEVRPEPDVNVQMDAISKGALVTFLMRDIMRVPYVIAPEVLRDRSPVSVNLRMPRSEIPVQVVRFLRSIGLTVELIGGTVYVSGSRGSAGVGPPGFVPGSERPMLPGQVQPGGGAPSASIAEPQQEVRPPAVGAASPIGASPIEQFEPVVLAIARPANRDASFFVEALQSLFPELRIAARAGFEPSQFEIRGPLAPEVLVMTGSEADVLVAIEVIKALDTPPTNVVISTVVVELSQRNERGSALSILASALGGVLDVSSLAGAASPLPQSAGITVGGLSAIVGAINEDGRFSIVAEPRLMVISGGSAVLNSGAEVPTIGAVTLTEDGQPFRSIEYRQSGLTLEVTATVVGDTVRVGLRQERSSFGRTDTGVDESPTLNQASVTSDLVLQRGEIALLAGVDEAATSETRSGLFAGLLGARRSSTSAGQLIVLISADWEPQTDAGEPSFVVHYVGEIDAPT